MSIPKTFHRIWFSETGELEPKRFARFWRWFQELHPDWEFVTWNNESDYSWLINKEAFEEADIFGRRPDVLRYEILNRYGGFYIDTDVEPLKPFDDLVDDDRYLIGLDNADHFMTAVMACPPGHPAVKKLIQDLPESMKMYAGRGPDFETGPTYATRELRRRSDVRVMPSKAFGPVFWTEMEKLGGPYPSESYAVHHWASLWRPKRLSNHTISFSILVPFTSQDPQRIRVWEWLRDYWETYLPEAEIVLGEYDQVPFSRATAINNAAKKANTDLFFIVDADTYVPFSKVRRCIKMAATNPRQWYLPHMRWVDLTQDCTERILSSDKVPTDFEHQGEWTGLNGAAMIIHRAAYESVGGFDERFVGWGPEDQSFIHAVDTLYGPHTRVAGEVYNLWHPRSGAGAKQRYPGQDEVAGGKLGERYLTAAGNPEGMMGLLEEAHRARDTTWHPPKVKKTNRPKPRRVVREHPFSIIVAHRDDSTKQHRTRLWSFIEDRLRREFPQTEIVVASDDGNLPFCKSMATNNAAMAASTDVLLLLDSDSWLDKKALLEAVDLVATGDAMWVKPWSLKVKLNAEDTEAILQQGLDWDGTVSEEMKDRAEAQSRHGFAPPLVMSRTTYAAVNGMDERFRGWGYEDVAMGLALKTLVGPVTIVDGDCIHLFHKRMGRIGRYRWNGQEDTLANRSLYEDYRMATGDPKQMLRVIQGEKPITTLTKIMNYTD